MSYLLLYFLLLLLVILIALSYLFSGAETAFVASNTAKLNKLSTLEGNNRAATIVLLKNQKEDVIGSILIANNILNILASSISAMISFEMFGGAGVAISSFIISFIIIVFAEVLPKTYAMNNPEKVALGVGPFLHVSVKICYPLTRIVASMVRAILYLLGKANVKESTTTFESIRNLIAMQEKDKIKEDAQGSLEIINNILDLTDRSVSRIMTHKNDIFSIDCAIPLVNIINQSISSGYNYVPLWKGDKFHLHILIDTEIAVDLLKHKAIENISLGEISNKPIFTLDKTPISVQLYNFKKNKTNFVIVQDEYGELKGIVTLSDVLEEIVGNVYGDSNKRNITQTSVGHYIINGKTHIRDINNELKWSLPDTRAVTLSGLIMNELERVPKQNETLVLHGHEIKIISTVNNSIIKVQVKEMLNAD